MFLSEADINELYLVKLVSEQCATGAGGGIIPAFVDGPPAKFRREQLGLGWGEYPSIIEVQRELQIADARAQVAQARKDRKQGVRTKPRMPRALARTWIPRRGCSFEEATALQIARQQRKAELVQERAARQQRQLERTKRDDELAGERAHRTLEQLGRAHRKPYRRADARPQLQRRRAELKAIAKAERRALES